ncbi:nuclear transport factor 2 family protein [Pseudonocardia endophytica]|uniref:SnoaL-like protein n=1 Tax=Pseudonocardia endophytica TaxID=401976 RepID=A0A4R1I1A7_PSEEN|nr:nuclear transport factor 2 family protein [Pseudonocardia endophytica]TCK27693.1 SnoaL-like protein [Pseudonocardia endophytica]
MTAEPSVAHRFADAFHARDADRVADLFTPDAEYRDLFYGLHRGRSGIRALFARMFDEGRDHRWEMATVVTDGTTTAAEWRFTFTVTGPESRGGGRTLVFDGMSVFVTSGALCHRYREYFDRGAALLAVGLAPDAVARVVRNRPAITVHRAEDAGSWTTTAGS